MSSTPRLVDLTQVPAVPWAWVPDLSQAGDAQYRRDGAPRDSDIRQFYVGATRTREKLYLRQRETGMAVAI
jgi:hypothetical protein